MCPEHHAPAGATDSPENTFDDELAIAAEQWAREDAAVRAELLRRKQERIENRRLFGNPIAMHDLQRVMVAWTALRPASATYEQAPPARVPRTSWRDLMREHNLAYGLETFMADWVADSLESRV
ncbi:hypothetical protein SAMN05414139_01464 [Burkholderia sp. D7]|nr:hypothetical protein SAMN05414139_01464 [Burkholderia sp. D7]